VSGPPAVLSPPSSRSRFAAIFRSSLAGSSPDLASLHYSVLGAGLLGEAVASSGALCATLGASQGETNVETLYQVRLEACTE
jgi:hypothetical protein